MIFIHDNQAELGKEYTIGGKAKNLFRLIELKVRVPKFMVIPQEVLAQLIPKDIQTSDYQKIIEHIHSLYIPKEVINTQLRAFSEDALFAVRSSALDEDGNDFSFAGQFESQLFVSRDKMAESIKAIWVSAFAERVYQYREINHLPHRFGLAVIIQEMINADVAGVAFGVDPSSGDRKAKVISAVFGLGEGLVSGEFDSDNYLIKEDKVTSQIANKTHKLVLNTVAKEGLIKADVALELRNKAALTMHQALEISSILDHCNRAFGKPQDMEFAIYNNDIYLLQTRPITNLHKMVDTHGEYILWDNSNIIESYPGVTSPLTFSFISKSYEGAYKMFSEFMGVHPKTIDKNERVFANTLGYINGRVYYNLKTWYHMLAMLPGYSINARFMEKMMGVKERFDIPDAYRLSKGAAWWSILKMGFQMYRRFLALPQKRRAFMVLLNDTISAYKKIDYNSKNANELMQLYLNFDKKLLNEWKAPLLNDFFAMIWFGLLQKRCEKFNISKNPNIHNDLLCGSNDIISVQPIHRCIALASMISEDTVLKTLFMDESIAHIWEVLKKDEKFEKLKREIDKYLNDFGERCMGELKLETISYSQDPTKFIKILKSYVESGINLNTTSNKVEDTLRQNAEKELNEALKYSFFKKRRLKKTLRLARELVSSRENLRYERTRAFGIIREIFSHIGRQFFSEGIIENPRDIFYLSKEEIFSFIEGTSITQNIKALILIRKAEFEIYQNQPAPSERFASYGPVYHANDFYNTSRIEKVEGDLKGIGCSPGIVKGKVRVVINPNEISSLNGDILVTTSTDPGWVTLFPSAAGIIVERGSLLSHSAIVSREMGKPCIVSVTGLLKTLRTGDEIEMDGSSGAIKILESTK